MKKIISRIPIVRNAASFIYFVFVAPFRRFPGSKAYWQRRYKNGGESGAGSYNKLSEFKAEVLNDFVTNNDINTVLEFGCGDGNQLKLSNYPSYTGFDVSFEAILRCKALFENSANKTFFLMDEYKNETAELTLSLDVLYHLIEDRVFNAYMDLLFNSSLRFVIIYSSNTNVQSRFQAAHLKHRKFSDWVERNEPNWKQVKHVANRYPYQGDDDNGSFADFYIFEKVKSIV